MAIQKLEDSIGEYLRVLDHRPMPAMRKNNTCRIFEQFKIFVSMSNGDDFIVLAADDQCAVRFHGSSISLGTS